MKFFFLIFILGCASNRDDNSLVIKNNNQTETIFESIHFGNCIKSSSLIVNNDCVFIYSPNYFKNDTTYLAESFWFRKDSLKIINNPSKIISTNIFKITIDKKSKDGTYFQAIGNPKIKYEKINPIFKSKLQDLGENNKDTRVQIFNDKSYFIDKFLSKKLFISDTKDNSIKSYKFEKDGFFEVTDFFLKDITGDGNPEIFIFHIGDIARENTISYDIYSFK